MTFAGAEQLLNRELRTVYESREAANIADLLMEHLSGLKKIDRIIEKEKEFAAVAALNNYLKDLLAHKPVQYVLREAWFFGMKFFVNENVLIPRPETEELVQWVIEESNKDPAILDIGTGSGCISIALKRKIDHATVFSCDTGGAALDVARKNALSLGTTIHFLQLDILDDSQWNALPELDIIVSNPPYIPLKDKGSMADNVVKYEPHLALFVADGDPLIFYRAIAKLGLQKLSAGGKIYVEVHEDLAAQVAELFGSSGYRKTVIKKDLQGKERMVSAERY